MAQSALVADDRETRSAETLPGQGIDRLQELMRHGYVPCPGSQPSSGLLLRHPTGPDLILRRDGGVDVPLGQALKPMMAPAPAAPPRRKRRWLRGMLIIFGLMLYTFLALAVLSGIAEGL